MFYQSADAGQCVLDFEAFTACAVEETVTGLDGIVDLIGASVVIDLP